MKDALSAEPANGLDVMGARERLMIALSGRGGELKDEPRTAIAKALASPSPVDAVVGAFDVLAGAGVIEQCGPALVARAIEVASVIARWNYHGKGEAASACAAAWRAAL